MSRVTFAALSAAVLLVLTGCSDDDGDTAEDQSSSGGSCEYPQAGEPAKEVDPPAENAAHDGDVPVTIETSAGAIEATLDAGSAPCTVNSFTSLADQGYFDGSVCHRLTTDGIYVLQCGDPTASGMGGPGYSFPDELEGDETYGPGTLAMANSGPDTNGSQFFIVYDDSPLDPAYTVFGEVSEEGIGVVEQIAAGGTDTGAGDGAPKTPVEIQGVTVD
ncbi:MAG TPA: peptidylprolyl isomerase [Nocardioides sp.]|nr:peptidylprolyl isomerase [Nocardioides sp.]